MNAFRFYSPLWFLLAPVAIFVVWHAWHPRRRAAAVFSSLADLKGIPVTLAQRVRRLFPYVYAAGLLLLVTGLARPQMGTSESRTSSEGIAIQLAIDISGSMEALDFQLDGKDDTRINAVKHVVKQFVGGSKEDKLGGRPNDMIGVVAFGGFAESRCPPTLDHGAVLQIVDSLELPKKIFDNQGRITNNEDFATAIGDGLALSIDRLRSTNAKSKVLILLTDGDNNAGVVEPLAAAKAAAEAGIKIYAIGAGRNGVAPVAVEDQFGRRVLRAQFFKMDEEVLKEIARVGNGKYYNATNTKALAEVYADIDKLERTKVESLQYTEYTELYHYLLLPGMALLLGVSFLTATRFRSLP